MTATADSGTSASIHPPKPLPPRPSSQPRKSPWKSACSTHGAAPRDATTPAGSATSATTANRQPARRLRQPAGTSCQRCAAATSVSGTTNSPVTSGITAFSKSGANTSPATKPSTTLGKPAMSSIVGLMRAFHVGCMNWLA
ncbi:MAG: hypothetical protein EBZ59_08180 [Planctomycetia bacterium]|nr:hypothetical protein [Planctomycetia bacterium]